MGPTIMPDSDGDYSQPLKRRKLAYRSTENDSLYDRYTIAWICALYIETAAALVMLDETHDELPRRPNDNNAYTLGRIKNHNIVIACLPQDQYGNNNAANVLTSLTRTFPSIRRGLMVGIGGGAPGKVDIHLGDIVVGTRIMQYDLGKVMTGGQILRTATPKSPDYSLCTAVANLRAKHELSRSQVPLILQERIPQDTDYHRPSAPDYLFQKSYEHDVSKSTCESCDHGRLEKRELRRSNEPKIHYGGIGSSNQVMKDAVTRDSLAEDLDIICFEMEAAGLMDVLPCLPIRGICDYSDSHKAKGWQKYAAAVAAAYARELLESLPATGDASDSVSKDHPPQQVDTGDRRQQLLESLRFEQIDSRKTTIKAAYSKTCSWLLKHPDYLEWLDSAKQPQHHGFFWIRGKPGAGKSILMKFIYINSKKTDICRKALTISFFFNARGDLLEQSVSGMYRSLLLQLLEGYPDLQRVLDDPDLIPRTQLTTCPSLNVLKDLFRYAVSFLEGRSLTCIVDALDECDEQQIKDMIDFFEELAEQCVENTIRFQVCFSSRHYPYVDIKSGVRLTLEGQEGHSEDLKHYISKHLRIADATLVEELKQMMLEKAAGVFLWVALVVNILNKEDSRGRLALRRRLQEVPSQLSELFRDILTRDQEHIEDLLLSILWILLAKRPLTPEEYYHAIWCGLFLKGLADVEIPPITSDAEDCFNKCIISSSKGLAETTRGGKPTVQFMHESVRDFLIKDGGLYELWPELGADWESHGHERLKFCCNAYVFHEAIVNAIDKQQFSGPRAMKNKLLEEFPFLEYASQFVLSHANSAAYKISQQRFLGSFPVSNWVRIFNVFENYKVRKYNEDADILYILAERGCPELIRIRLETHPGIERGGGRYRHPLLAAIAKGNKDSVIALLGLSSRFQNGIDITKDLECSVDSVQPDHTPLTWAFYEGHLGICALLLDQSPQVRESDFRNFMESDDTEFVKRVLEKGWYVTTRSRGGKTPLHVASENGFLDATKLLLDKGADIQAKAYGRCSPLHIASANGHLEVAKMLLDKGANVNAEGIARATPLHEASKNGHLEVVRLLLNNVVDPGATDENGMTPLYIALRRGHIDTVKLLLDKGADIAVIDKHRRTLLHIASANGHLEVAKMLLDKGANVNAEGIARATPLHEASKNGHLEVVRLLLNNVVDPGATDENGMTPLHIALRRGHIDTVKLLLDKGADIAAIDKYRRTPLHIASRWGHIEVVKILLDKGADTTAIDQDGKTPLFEALDNDYIEIAKMLT